MKVIAVSVDDLVIKHCKKILNSIKTEVENFVPYGQESLTLGVNEKGLTVSGCSMYNNLCEVTVSDNAITLHVDATRHSIHAKNNMAGWVFSCFFYNQKGTVLYKEYLRTFELRKYSSFRKDRPFWEYGLEKHACGQEYARARANGLV